MKKKENQARKHLAPPSWPNEVLRQMTRYLNLFFLITQLITLISPLAGTRVLCRALNFQVKMIRQALTKF